MWWHHNLKYETIQYNWNIINNINAHFHATATMNQQKSTQKRNIQNKKPSIQNQNLLSIWKKLINYCTERVTYHETLKLQTAGRNQVIDKCFFWLIPWLISSRFRLNHRCFNEPSINNQNVILISKGWWPWKQSVLRIKYDIIEIAGIYTC